MDMSQLQQATNQVGVMGQPLEVIPVGPLRVIASPISDRQVLRSPPMDAVLTFRSVVEAVFEAGPVVPLRFGTVTQSSAQAASLVREKKTPYLNLLHRLTGHVEMGISVDLESEAMAEEGGNVLQDTGRGDAGTERPGTTYLRRQRERLVREQARMRQAVAPIQRAVTDQVGDVDMTPPTASEDRVSLAFLIPRDKVEPFREAVKQAQAPGASSAEIVGPWAPYSFV